MFSLKEFLKKGLIDAVGKMADYQIILNAAGWYDKGVFTETDLADIQSEIDNKNFEEERAEEIEADMVLE
jgi:hypothetical protein